MGNSEGLISNIRIGDIAGFFRLIWLRMAKWRIFMKSKKDIDEMKCYDVMKEPTSSWEVFFREMQLFNSSTKFEAWNVNN